MIGSRLEDGKIQQSSNTQEQQTNAEEALTSTTKYENEKTV